MPPNRATKNKTRHCTSLADEEIRPNGDSVLVVGKERTILRVDSQTLIAASKVFKRLFQNSSSEAQDPAGNIVKVVYLEDDDPEAMWTLCCLLHDVYEIGDEEMVPPEVFLTAMHVKKFDLMGRDPVRGAMHLWLNPKLSTRFNGFEMGFHFAAAYLLQQLSSVVRWSQDLIFGYGGDYDALVAEILSRILPPQVFDFLARLRAEARADVERLLGVDLWGLVRRYSEVGEEMRAPIPETGDAVSGILSVLRLLTPDTVSKLVAECDDATRYLYQPCPHGGKYPSGLEPVLHAIEFEKFRRISCLLIFIRKTRMRLHLLSHDAKRVI